MTWDEWKQAEETARRKSVPERCEVCRTELIGGDCEPCMRATYFFNARISIEPGAADSDLVYHELAHFMVLFRRVWQGRRDARRMQDQLDRMSLGHAQLHELRVVKVQYLAYRALGWRPRLDRVVGLSWPGVRDANMERSGRDLVRSETHMKHLVQAIVPSKSLVRAYTRELQRLRSKPSRSGQSHG